MTRPCCTRLYHHSFLRHTLSRNGKLIMLLLLCSVGRTSLSTGPDTPVCACHWWDQVLTQYRDRVNGGRWLGPVRHAGSVRISAAPHLQRRGEWRRQLLDKADAGIASLQTVTPAGKDGRPQENCHSCCYEPYTHSSGPGESVTTGQSE